MVDVKVGEYIKSASKYGNGLDQRSARAFLCLSEQLKVVLEEGKLNQVEGRFVDFKGFIIFIPHVLLDRDANHAFGLVNQLVCEVLSNQIDQVVHLAGLKADSFTSPLSSLQWIKRGFSEGSLRQFYSPLGRNEVDSAWR